ncbi:MAG TPA: hypothetical protein V6C97_25235, partial [Oculatellaceae cyanobacterium]
MHPPVERVNHNNNNNNNNKSKLTQELSATSAPSFAGLTISGAATVGAALTSTGIMTAPSYAFPSTSAVYV